MSADQDPAADWWCWTENAPSSFRCRERGHDVRPGRTPAELSTSARLRQVEAERDEIRAAAGRNAEKLLYARTELGRVQRSLAASQADLTRVERERDQACALSVDLLRDTDRIRQVETELDGARAQIDSDRELIDQLITDRAGLRAEVEKLRIQLAAVVSFGFIVARDGGRYCERCEQEITRGQAYTVTAGAENLLEHVHCPDTDASVSHTQVPECTTDPTEEPR